jgi:hypothetical protein
LRSSSPTIVLGLLKGFGTAGTAIAVMLYPREVAEAQGNILPLTPVTLEIFMFLHLSVSPQGQNVQCIFLDGIVLFFSEF